MPNFEDQSFEEIRYLCYEAKNNGSLQTLLPQLSQQASDASYKLSMLCDVNNVNNNLLHMLVNLYNSGDSTRNNQTSMSGGNPFAISSRVGGGQPSSLFGNSTTTQQQNPFGGSLFGSTPATNAFGSGTKTSNNFFGGGGTSIFGTSTPARPFPLSQIGQPIESSKPSSIFGTSQFQQTQDSIFGSAPAFGNQPSTPSGLFSSASTNSIFGQNQSTTPSGLFGQNNSTNQSTNSGNLFASQQPQGPIFPSTESKSIFGQGINSNQNIFGTNQQQSSNIFAGAY